METVPSEFGLGDSGERVSNTLKLGLGDAEVTKEAVYTSRQRWDVERL